MDDIVGKDDIHEALRTRHTYGVSIPEVWNRTIQVEATSEQEAIDKVNEGIKSGRIECGGTEELEFGYDMASSYWTAEKHAH